MTGVWQLALIISVAAFGLLGVPALIWGPGYLRHREERRVLASGLPARAMVIGLEDTGNRFNETPEVIVRLELHAEGRSPWQASVRRIVSPAEIPAFAPGRKLTARFDPKRPDSIALVP